MASFDELINSLLEDIALCGSVGASASDFACFVQNFYSSRKGILETEASEDKDQVPKPKPSVDRAFLSEVWRWLTARPDVSVGLDRQGNQLSLSELEAPSILHHASNAGSHEYSNLETVEDSLGGPWPASAVPSSRRSLTPAGALAVDKLRIYANEERMWLAIAGQPKETSGLFALEFQLLSIIASYRHDGILQGDLVRASGQDKRSVPKRTDALRDKGYIEKRPVQAKGQRTSLLILQKFSRSPDEPEKDTDLTIPLAEGQGTAVGGRDGRTTSSPNSRHSISNGSSEEIVDLGALIKELFNVLRNHGIIDLKGLKRKMGIETAPKSKVLSRMIRRLEANGCVKRVRAASEYSERLGYLHPCVKLVREPSEVDLRLYGVDVSSTDLIGPSSDGEEDLFPSEQGDKPPDSPIADEAPLHEVERILPQWTPDRNLPNLLYESVESAGTQGISINGIRNSLFGQLFHRPVEHLIDRVARQSLESQPPHLRHLSLVRDTAMVKQTAQYIHYSFDNFDRLVQSGQATWDAVQEPHLGSRKRAIAPTQPADTMLDEHGFLLSSKPLHQLKGGEITLTEGLKAAKPGLSSKFEPEDVASATEDEQYAISYGRWEWPTSPIEPGTPKGDIASRKRMPKVGRSQSKRSAPAKKKKKFRVPPTGRPRKYLEGTEDFWKHLRKKQRVGTGKGAAFHYKGLAPAVHFADDPVGFSHANRPDSFDQTLLRAIRSSLPLPDCPEDINGKWMDKTNYVLDRSAPGLYVTPRGEIHDDLGPYIRTSQIVFFRLPRLNELDFSPYRNNPSRRPVRRILPLTASTVRFLASSAAHTLPYLQVSAATRPSKRLKTQHLGESGSPGPKGPKLGYFEVTDQTLSALAQGPSQKTAYRAISSAELGRVSRRSMSIDSVGTTDLTPGIADSSKSEKITTTAQQVTEKTPPSAQEGVFDIDHNIEAGSVENGAVHGDLAALSDISTEDDLPVMQVQRQNLKPHSGRGVWGGSIAASRRQIIFDLLEQCGGVYPYDQEIWRPFTTAWLKTNKTTRPDMRTIKSTVKSMFDTGKIKQLTFSFKDLKGIMVTKEIIAKPELSANNPKIRDLQRHMIAANPDPYFPPGVEINWDLKKSSWQSPGDTRRSVEVDFEEDVKLVQKPVTIQRIEKRNARKTSPPGKGSLTLTEPTDGVSSAYEPRKLRTLGRSSSLQLQITTSVNQAIADLSTPSGDNELPDETGADFGSAEDVEASQDSGTSVDGIVNDQSPQGISDLPPRRYPRRTRTQGARTAKRRQDPPDSLEEMIAPFVSRRKLDLSTQFDPAYSVFEWEVDTVEKWELKNEALLGAAFPGFRFINHFVGGSFAATTVESRVKEKNGRLVHTRKARKPEKHPETPTKPPIKTLPKRPVGRPRKVREPANSLNALTGPAKGRAGLRAAPTPTAKKRYVADVEDSDFEDSVKAPTSGKRRRKDRDGGASLRRLDALLSKDKVKEAQSPSLPPAPTTERVRRLRGPQFLKNMPEHLVYRMTTAIVVVRTLAGGLDRNIDWALVMQCIPEFDTQFVKERWRTILSKNFRELDRMTEDLQVRYVSAYEKGQVPPIDYDNLEEYDWNAVVNWAMRELRQPLIRDIPDLPGTREELESISSIRLEEPRGLQELYLYNTNITVPRRKALIASAPFAIRHDRPPPALAPAEDEDLLELAKSWIRATVLTEERNYDAMACRAKLEPLGETLLSLAQKSLVEGKIIRPRSQGRNIAARNYDVTEAVLNALTKKRTVEMTQLRQASKYKLGHLDVEFQRQGFAEFNEVCEDGDALALMNLLSQGRIAVIARDPPKKKWGMMENYQPRFLPKRLFDFTIDIRPIDDRYPYGNPLVGQLNKQQDMPRGDLDRNGKIPVWFDVHGNFIKIMWDMALGAVLGCLVQRPGIAAKEISEMLKPGVGVWEVDLLLQWLEGLGLAERTRAQGGWEVKGFWWMVLADISEAT